MFSSSLLMNYEYYLLEMFFYGDTYVKMGVHNIYMLRVVHTTRKAECHMCFHSSAEKTSERGRDLGSVVLRPFLHLFGEERSRRPPNSKCHSRIRRQRQKTREDSVLILRGALAKGGRSMY